MNDLFNNNKGDTMNEFETKRASLEDKYANAPEQVTKEDLESYESFYALKTYFWNNQEKTKVVLGDYEVTHTFRRGISSNSGKSKSPTQHKFIIKNLTNDEQWEDGLINTTDEVGLAVLKNMSVR